ncbi:hypothetical protein R1T08_34790 [Streptomyces sp. SBC-4]|nr:hypothetical protein [Streptomyces sp. SBC-4]MDV5149168.1 hypothetical protein [Streptomyces sp. SBC-4]
MAGHPELEGRSVHEAFREHQWRVLAVRSVTVPPQPTGDTLAGFRYDPFPGFDWRPAHGRVLRAGGRVVLATSRQGLDVLMSGVQPHPPGRRGERAGERPGSTPGDTIA